MLERGDLARDPAKSPARTAARNPTHLFGLTPAFFAVFAGETPVSSAAITYSGGVNGTRVNSAGVIVAAACPRIDYDPTALAVRGLLVEESRTNLLLNSLIDGTNLSTQSVTLPASAHTLTFYGTGTVTLSGAFVGSLVGSGAYPTRSTLTFTPSAGSVTFTVTGTVQYAQLEAGAFATSYIPTAGSAVARTTDQAQVALSSFAYSSSQGALFHESSVISNVQGASAAVLFQAASGSAEVIRFNAQRSSSNSGGAQFTSASVAQADLFVSGSPPTPGAFNKVAVAWALDDFASSFNALALQTDSSGVVPVGLVNLFVSGNAPATGSRLNGHLRRILYWNTRLPNATLQALTA